MAGMHSCRQMSRKSLHRILISEAPGATLWGGCVCQARQLRSGPAPGSLLSDRDARATDASSQHQQQQGSELPPPQTGLVDQVLSGEHMASRELHKVQLQEIRRQFQRFPGDCGSTEVQVAALTQKIRWMTQHMRTHQKDFHSRRGLEGWLSQRRSLLQYLRRTQFDAYATLITRLGLKDSYAKQDRYSVYPKKQLR